MKPDGYNSVYICSQAVRYLMRFQTEYMCDLLNVERHVAFGKEAAKIVLPSLDKEWPKVCLF